MKSTEKFGWLNTVVHELMHELLLMTIIIFQHVSSFMATTDHIMTHVGEIR